MEGESSTQTNTPAGAVFLIYGSQDAEAARRICTALRSAGVEVWFDQSELRRGDAWDQKIRREIHDCALFIPVISVHTAPDPRLTMAQSWHTQSELDTLLAQVPASDR